MFHTEDVLQLKDDEEVRCIVRRHPSSLAPGLFVALVLIVVPFFLMFPLFGWGVYGAVLFVAAVIFGISAAIRTLLLWDSNVLIVTTLRLVDVDQRGLFSRMVSEAPHESIQDVSWAKHGLWETVFRMGSVKVQTAGNTANIEMKRIGKPDRVAELVNELRRLVGEAKSQESRVRSLESERVKQEKPVGDTVGKIRSINAILESFSFEELAGVENALKARQRASMAEEFFDKDEEGEKE